MDSFLVTLIFPIGVCCVFFEPIRTEFVIFSPPYPLMKLLLLDCFRKVEEALRK